jgi:hypothetical protein
MKSLPALALAALSIFSTSALAYDEPDCCYTTSDPRCSGSYCGNTFYNPTVSANWQRTAQSADPQAMQQMAGVYYAEFSSSDGLYYDQMYRSYDAGGVWTYQDQTCTVGSNMPCAQGQGAGQWAAYPQADGTIFVMIHFSDLNHSNNCVSQTVRRVDAQGYSDEYGSWRRVR